ncbi:MAG TPA: hypothetical protein VHZ95_07380 [Polyangiales bacterium]|jgi:hypothetical protein|nr:hypothetical protein [Polyangiales bacterium]
MVDTAVRRFLELVTRELGADDARAELGGRDPNDAGIVFKNLPDGWRIVALFDTPPADRAAVQSKLDSFAESFRHTLAELHPPVPTTSNTLPARRLDDALDGLRARTGALSVIVIDGNSPMLWGSSETGREFIDVDELSRVGLALSVARDRGVTLDQLTVRDADALLAVLRNRGVDRAVEELLAFLVARDQDEMTVRRRLLTALAVAAVRARIHRSNGDHVRSVHHEPQYGYIARGLANIYQIVVIFGGAFSELHVESAIVHALPLIEELLFALPPVDPPPGKGQVLRMRPR